MRWIWSLFVIFLFYACSTTKQIESIPEVFINDVFDTLVVSSTRVDNSLTSLPDYKNSARRTIDLHHMDLDLNVDWSKQSVHGTATLLLSPYFYPIDTVVLDAKAMNIDGIVFNNKSIGHTNNGKQIFIPLGKKYTNKDSLYFEIRYSKVAGLGQISGFSDDQGIYFKNALSTSTQFPPQLWTQGETEYNSHWFPTVDKPNEKYTHTIAITVDDKYQTLSNGMLKQQQNLPGAQRKDTWVMDQPHAPYLTVLVVGEFSVTEDEWEDIPLYYYVDPKFESDAKEIFNHTPEMLTFFSEYTGVKFPWDKYAQVVVTEFVAGAMENTTASVFGDFVQKKKESLKMEHNDDIVAHELMHHWFGNYVTCESWANLTLNEGFANYAEYLWRENKYGKHDAEVKRRDEFLRYLTSIQFEGIHPLIHHEYVDENEMFDTHSYNKGGLVLHMLRKKIGEEAFKESIKRYLEQNKYKTVELDHLRLAVEEVTGLDLQVFFSQWYYYPGHPKLKLDYTQDKNNSELTIDIEQTQSIKKVGLYELPMEWVVHYENGGKETFNTTMNQSKFTYRIPINGKISWVDFDPECTLLAEVNETKEKTWIYNELLYSDSSIDQLKTIQDLYFDVIPEEILLQALNHVSHEAVALELLEKLNYNKKTRPHIEKYLMKHSESKHVYRYLDYSLDDMTLDYHFTKQMMEKTSSLDMKSVLLRCMARADINKTYQYASQLQSHHHPKLVVSKLGVLLANNEKKDFDYVLSEWKHQDSPEMVEYLVVMYNLMAMKDKSDQYFQRLVDFYKKEKDVDKRRIWAESFTALEESIDLKKDSNKERLLNHIEQVKAFEKESEILHILDSFIANVYE